MGNFGKNIALWVIIGLLLISLFNLFQGSVRENSQTKISFSDFMAQVDSGNVSEVNIQGNNVEGFFSDGRSFNTYAPNYPDLVDKLNSEGVKISAEPVSTGMHPLLSIFVFLVLLCLRINWVVILMVRQLMMNLETALVWIPMETEWP